MTALERATRQALSASKRTAGVDVVYRRGQDAVTCVAIRGTTDSRTRDAEGVRLGLVSADYLIDADDLDFGAGLLEPAIGDEIEDAGHTFEVIAIGDRCWGWHDRYGVRRRIHTLER